jgi:hypothetical protein
MTFQLRPEQEQVIGQAIEAGLIRGADEVVEVGVEAIRQRLEACSRKVSAARLRAVVERTSCVGEWAFAGHATAVG